MNAEEIFGPLLPIYAYTSLTDLVKRLNREEKPLALYMYSQNKKNINYVIEQTRAGGTCINHNGIQYYNQNLPFGGSNNSGIGKAHGWYAFQEFSNARGIYTQHIPGPLELLTPPYNKFKQWVTDIAVKYL